MGARTNCMGTHCGWVIDAQYTPALGGFAMLISSRMLMSIYPKIRIQIRYMHGGTHTKYKARCSGKLQRWACDRNT